MPAVGSPEAHLTHRNYEWEHHDNASPVTLQVMRTDPQFLRFMKLRHDILQESADAGLLPRSYDLEKPVREALLEGHRPERVWERMDIQPANDFVQDLADRQYPQWQLLSDNLRAHKTEEALAAFATHCAPINGEAQFLPAYSPMMNMCEYLFSKLKVRSRRPNLHGDDEASRGQREAQQRIVVRALGELYLTDRVTYLRYFERYIRNLNEASYGRPIEGERDIQLPPTP